MPTLFITTNVNIADAKAFIVEFSKKGAETLGKPEQFICVDINYSETLAFNGTFDPAFVLNVVSLKNFSFDENERMSKAFFEFFNEKLGISTDRGYITFVDPGVENVGYKGTHFGRIWGSK